MAKLDVYSADLELANIVAPDVFRVEKGSFSVRLGRFIIKYPLADPHYRVVLGVLRSDEDPLAIHGVSVVFVIFTYRDGVSVPLRVGVTYLPDKYGKRSTAVVVDGFPVYITFRSVISLSKVRDYISRYRLLASA